MNQFIIENPVLCIVIAFIIGAVIMNITSVLAIRMAVENEVEKALGEEDDERIGLYPVKPSNAPVPPAPIIHKRVLPIWLGKDEDGTCYVFFDEPQMHEAGTGPCSETIESAYYTCEGSVYLHIDDLYDGENSSIISYLQKEFKKMDNLKYGTRKLYLCNRDVIEVLNGLPGFH